MINILKSIDQLKTLDFDTCKGCKIKRFAYIWKLLFKLLAWLFA
ncbi:hypothetical protein SeseC_02606 [Streptococcus equi subsp. zooepidemicus ATCC 35246]|nr:hypothetical protein SeseC_02606 [Streptococcus equi subsp. zooepidemicus ATCC 35246]